MSEYRDEKTGRFYKGFTPHNKGKGIPKEGDKECPICHKTFHYVRSGNNPEPKTCSKECRYKSCSITHMGKNNYNTINYPRTEKRKAQRIIQRLIKQGVLKRDPCIFCGDKDSQPHHYKGYAKENWLEIKWLCKRCHYDEHVRLRKTGESLLL